MTGFRLQDHDLAPPRAESARGASPESADHAPITETELSKFCFRKGLRTPFKRRWKGVFLRRSGGRRKLVLALESRLIRVLGTRGDVATPQAPFLPFALPPRRVPRPQHRDAAGPELGRPRLVELHGPGPPRGLPRSSCRAAGDGRDAGRRSGHPAQPAVPQDGVPVSPASGRSAHSHTIPSPSPSRMWR